MDKEDREFQLELTRLQLIFEWFFAVLVGMFNLLWATVFLPR